VRVHQQEAGNGRRVRPLQQKKERRDAAGEAAQSAIASVMRTEAGSPAEHMASASAEPVFRACALVGASLGIKVYEHPNADEARTYEDQVLAIASASGFRTRTVALRGEWYNEDHGSLLGQRAESSDRSRCCRTSRNSTSSSIRRPASAIASRRKTSTASASSPTRSTARSRTARCRSRHHQVRFVGMGSDVRWVLLMAMIVGMCGTVTPYFTGKIFDEAVPQADRSSLIVYGLAMLGFAFAMAAFKFVQGVATLRISTRMGSSIQSALWDRIMVLPVNFFRRTRPATSPTAPTASRRSRRSFPAPASRRFWDRSAGCSTSGRCSATTSSWRWSPSA
jgi:ATP-binding cassette subfamily C protein